MEDKIFRIKENCPVARDVYHLRLEGDVSQINCPGQFASIKIDGLFLRRPFSICSWDESGLDIYYKAVGEGTEKLADLPAGTELSALTGLGNGYDSELSGGTPLLIGGGMGATPLYCLCRKLIAEGKKPTVILGFASDKDIFLADEFRALDADVILCTDDGSAGHQGFVTDVMAGLDYSYFYSCGPEGMFKAIDRIAKTEGQFSFEARMGCGFGACMGCTCKTHKGNKRICKDGPVLERSEIIW
ncbi:MAG: dihydroorotate dehydrogenase electron transfer subunit [Oscillospiraceae bacterium]|nr:dihydroorotate dehydrogenase electron transfer subunit [Oscillospiraceae bacterium]